MAERTIFTGSEGKGWNFFTNHSHVLFYLNFHPGTSMREIADHVGITERAVQKIVGDLAEEGIVRIGKTGRQNTYEVKKDYKLRHPIESHLSLGDLLAFIGKE